LPSAKRKAKDGTFLLPSSILVRLSAHNLCYVCDVLQRSYGVIPRRTDVTLGPACTDFDQLGVPPWRKRLPEIIDVAEQFE
jgi:hypothetical protein